MRISLRKVAIAGFMIAGTAMPAANAGPTAGIHEGAGYAVVSGPEGVAACTSVGIGLPATVTLPTGAVTWTATGLGLCEGNLPIRTNVVIEATSADGTKHLSNSCTGTNTCSLTVPAGWGTFYIMPSSFWYAPAGSTWIVENPVNNDGYCNPADSTTTDIVCRAWFTGVS